MNGADAGEPRWGAFGKKFLLRVSAHVLMVIALWFMLLFFEEFYRSAAPQTTWGGVHVFSGHWARLTEDLRPALIAGLMTLSCVGFSWGAVGAAAPLAVSLGFCFVATLVGGLVARFPIPERAPEWLLWSGPQTPRWLQLVLVVSLLLISTFFLLRRMTLHYESLNRDRLALSPMAEDHVIRALVQSMLLLVVTVFGGVATWNISNARPVPAVAQADLRELKPSVFVLAVDSDTHSKHLKARLGEPFFRSWVVFGRPETGAKFDEVLQCRYPIRLIGTKESARPNDSKDISNYFVPSSLAGAGYSVSLLHEGSANDTSEALKMLSRNFAHVRVFRRFGLLIPSSVFYTPDAQLAQIREALSSAVARGKSAFVTASLLSREGRLQTKEDSAQFEIFLDALASQNWLRNVFVVLLEFPEGVQDQPDITLSLGATSAQVTFWASGALADSTVNLPLPKLVRGIDLGASLAARLRLSSLVSQCDGAALFDISERPSVFPRDLVYQELDLKDGQDVFRKRGWLTSDGFRLEIQETNEGAISKTFKYSLKAGGYNRSWEPVDEKLVQDSTVSAELNRQLDEFLRTAGVEILNLGNGRTAYSEPFRRVRLLQ